MDKKANVVHIALCICIIVLVGVVIRQQGEVTELVAQRPTVPQVVEALNEAISSITEGTLTYSASWIDSGDGMSYTFTLTKGVKQTSEAFRKKFREELAERLRNPQEK